MDTTSYYFLDWAMYADIISKHPLAKVLCVNVCVIFFPLICSEDTKKKERDKATESAELKKDPSQPLKLTISSEQVELQKKAKEFLKQKSAEEEDTPSTYLVIFKYRIF
jgi:hypothetical protein